MTKVKFITSTNFDKLEFDVNTWLDRHRNDIEVVSTQYIPNGPTGLPKPCVMITYTV